MMNCPDCFKEQRSRRDIYLQIREDAKKYAIENYCKVAIVTEGDSYRYEQFSERIPEGTVEVITPSV